MIRLVRIRKLVLKQQLQIISSQFNCQPYRQKWIQTSHWGSSINEVKQFQIILTPVLPPQAHILELRLQYCRHIIIDPSPKALASLMNDSLPHCSSYCRQPKIYLVFFCRFFSVNFWTGSTQRSAAKKNIDSVSILFETFCN